MLSSFHPCDLILLEIVHWMPILRHLDFLPVVLLTSKSNFASVKTNVIRWNVRGLLDRILWRIIREKTKICWYDRNIHSTDSFTENPISNYSMGQNGSIQLLDGRPESLSVSINCHVLPEAHKLASNNSVSGQGEAQPRSTYDSSQAIPDSYSYPLNYLSTPSASRSPGFQANPVFNHPSFHQVNAYAPSQTSAYYNHPNPSLRIHQSNQCFSAPYQYIHSASASGSWSGHNSPYVDSNRTWSLNRPLDYTTSTVPSDIRTLLHSSRPLASSVHRPWKVSTSTTTFAPQRYFSEVKPTPRDGKSLISSTFGASCDFRPPRGFRSTPSRNPFKLNSISITFFFELAVPRRSAMYSLVTEQNRTELDSNHTVKLISPSRAHSDCFSTNGVGIDSKEGEWRQRINIIDNNQTISSMKDSSSSSSLRLSRTDSHPAKLTQLHRLKPRFLRMTNSHSPCSTKENAFSKSYRLQNYSRVQSHKKYKSINNLLF